MLCDSTTGVFTLGATQGAPVAFLTAGIGATPAWAHLQQLHADGQAARFRGALHVDRSVEHDVFRTGFADLAADSTATYTRMAYYTDNKSGRPAARRSWTRERAACRGWHNAVTAFVERAGTDTHYVLCGPIGFMRKAASLAKNAGVDNIHDEVFGTGSM